MACANLTAEELLVWSKDSLEFLIQQEWFDKENSSAPELVDRINTFLNEGK